MAGRSTLAVLGLLVLVLAANGDPMAQWSEATSGMSDVVMDDGSTVGKFVEALSKLVTATEENKALSSLTTQLAKLKELDGLLKPLDSAAGCPPALRDDIEDAYIAYMRAAAEAGECPGASGPAGAFGAGAGAGERSMAPGSNVACAHPCGLSKFDCLHDSTMDRAACPCRCNCGQAALWEGSRCESCAVKEDVCVHGKLSRETCTCNCQSPWKGRTCGECDAAQLECGDHGDKNMSVGKCQCDCHPGWGSEASSEEKCTVCQRTDKDCNGRGTINKTTCTCECTEKVSFRKPGTAADLSCALHPIPADTENKADYCKDKGCAYDAEADENKCKPKETRVKEVAWWKGDLCETCNLDGLLHCNGHTLNLDTCTCECDAMRWSGTACEVCSIGKEDKGGKPCANGAKVNEDTCECSIDCPAEFQTGSLVGATGSVYCDSCTLQDSQCRMGSTVDTASCKCKTSSFAGEGDKVWGGTFHDVCIAWDDGRECKHGGTWGDKATNKDCTCQACEKPWKGLFCNECDTTLVHCANGSTLDPIACKCVCTTDGPWEGDECTKCKLEQKDCQHGSVLDNSEGKCECKCEEGQFWISDEHSPIKICNVCNAQALSGCSGRSKIVDMEMCSCTACSGFATGLLCETCPPAHECKHGGTWNAELCRCDHCRTDTAGQECEKCEFATLDKECKHGAKANEKDSQSCDCSEGCPSQWKGGDIFCNKCNKEAVAAACGPRMASFDDDACLCVCKGKWSGERCDECHLSSADCNGGTVTADCECECPKQWTWDGANKDNCSKCNIAAADCHNGATPQLSTCECVFAPEAPAAVQYGGVFKNDCILTQASCNNGGTLNQGSCSCSCPLEYNDGPTCLGCKGGCHHGTCSHGRCKCDADWAGLNCEVPRDPTQRSCISVGDPHPVAWDGARWNYYGTGEYVMFQNPSRQAQVNVIYQRYQTNAPVSYTAGMAATWRGSWDPTTRTFQYHTVSSWYNLARGSAASCCYNGNTIDCNALNQLRVDDAVIRYSNGLSVKFPTSSGAANVNVVQSGPNVQMTGSGLPATGMSGLCGQNSAIQPPFPGSVADWYENHIRVKNENSLFSTNCHGQQLLDYAIGSNLLPYMELSEDTARAASRLSAHEAAKNKAALTVGPDTEEFPLSHAGIAKALAASVDQCPAQTPTEDASHFTSHTVAAVRKCSLQPEMCFITGQGEGTWMVCDSKECEDKGFAEKCEVKGEEVTAAAMEPVLRRQWCKGQWGSMCTVSESMKGFQSCLVDACTAGSTDIAGLNAAVETNMKTCLQNNPAKGMPYSIWNEEEKTCTSKSAEAIVAVEKAAVTENEPAEEAHIEEVAAAETAKGDGADHVEPEAPRVPAPDAVDPTIQLANEVEANEPKPSAIEDAPAPAAAAEH